MYLRKCQLPTFIYKKAHNFFKSRNIEVLLT